MRLILGGPKRGDHEDFDVYKERMCMERSLVDRYLMGRKLFQCRRCGQHHRTGEVCSYGVKK